MYWLNIETKTLRAPEFLMSAAAEQGTWLRALCYSADQENGGRIAGAVKWTDVQWRQICGVALEEVRAAKLLLTVDGEDILVAFYPLEKEAMVRTKREAGRRGGIKSGQARARQRRSIPLSTASRGARTEEKGMKEKGSEGNSSPVPPPSGHEARARDTLPDEGGGQEKELQPCDFHGMDGEAAFELLKQHFPDCDVWGAYKWLKARATEEGSRVTWPRLLAWLSKAGEIVRLPLRNPDRRERAPGSRPTEQPLTLEEQREMAEDFAAMRQAAGVGG